MAYRCFMLRPVLDANREIPWLAPEDGLAPDATKHAVMHSAAGRTMHALAFDPDGKFCVDIMEIVVIPAKLRSGAYGEHEAWGLIGYVQTVRGDEWFRKRVKRVYPTIHSAAFCAPPGYISEEIARRIVTIGPGLIFEKIVPLEPLATHGSTRIDELDNDDSREEDLYRDPLWCRWVSMG